MFRPWPKSRKWEKLCFGRGRRAENGKNRPLSADEMQKTMKIVCRRPTTDEKRKKMFIVGRRNAESLNFHSSSGDETKNTAKTARRRPTKRKIQQKLPVVGRRKPKLLIFCVSNPLESQKTGKNRVSFTDDERKTANSGFHPRMTSKKPQFLPFIHG